MEPALGRPAGDREGQGAASTNAGEIAGAWALAGHGILMRAEWNIVEYVKSGRLRIVLGDWQLPPADIFAVYPVRTNLSAKVRTFVDFLSQWLNARSWDTS